MRAYFIIYLCCIATPTYTSRAQQTTVPTIDFTLSHNLIAVYEAGLRPWRSSPTDLGMLFLTEERFAVIFPGGKRFEMEVSIGTFHLLAKNELGTVDLISQPMTVEEAQALTKEICQAFDVSIEGLDKFTDHFRELGKNPEKVIRGDPGTWTRFNIQKGGVRYGIAFDPVRAWDRTFATVNFSAQFYEIGKPMKFLTEPVKQPPGFEHVSMERQDKPSRGPSWMKPITGADLERGLVGKYPSITNKPNEVAALSPSPTSSLASSSAQPKPHSTNPIGWIIGLILLAGGVIFITRKKTPKV
jgi:hypothetical protein